MCKKLIVFILLFKSLGIVGQKNTISNRLNEVIVNASKRLKKSSLYGENDRPITKFDTWLEWDGGVVILNLPGV